MPAPQQFFYSPDAFPPPNQQRQSTEYKYVNIAGAHVVTTT